MSELRFLNEIVENIKQEIPEVQVSLHKRHSDGNFLKVESRILDPQLLYSVNSFAILTYDDSQDILSISVFSYKCEVLSNATLRFYDRDDERGLPTYILLLLQIFRETVNGVCTGIKAEEIYANFEKVTRDDLVRCLIERCTHSEGFIFRSQKCHGVYTLEHLEVYNGMCDQCDDLLASILHSDDAPKDKQDGSWRCPYADCGRSFRRLTIYKKHLRKHPATTRDTIEEEREEIDTTEDDAYDDTVLMVCETSINDSASDSEKKKPKLRTKETTSDMEDLGDQRADSGKRKRRRKEAGADKSKRTKKKTRLELICDKLDVDLSCADCSLSFSEKMQFARHMKSIHPGQFRCDHCGRGFAFKEEVSDHILKYHEKLSCDECGVLCLNQNSLSSHKSVVHRSTLEPCYVCGKWMKKPSIPAHIRLVHQAEEQRTHLCNICGNKYKTKTDLDRHYTKHTGHKKYYCSVCGKGYRFWGGADDCQRRHDQNLRYVCREDGCGKGFNSRFRLDQHLRTHSGVKPFQCPLCTYDCTRKDNLRKHIRGTHKYTVEQLVDLEKSASGFKKSQQTA